MSDYWRLHNLLELPRLDASLLVSDIETRLAARTVILRFLYQATIPSQSEKRTIEFTQCRFIYFEFLHDEEEDRTLADIIGVIFGQDDHGQFLLLDTDLYEAKISYGQLAVKRD